MFLPPRDLLWPPPSLNAPALCFISSRLSAAYDIILTYLTTQWLSISVLKHRLRRVRNWFHSLRKLWINVRMNEEWMKDPCGILLLPCLSLSHHVVRGSLLNLRDNSTTFRAHLLCDGSCTKHQGSRPGWTDSLSLWHLHPRGGDRLLILGTQDLTAVKVVTLKTNGSYPTHLFI